MGKKSKKKKTKIQSVKSVSATKKKSVGAKKSTPRTEVRIFAVHTFEKKRSNMEIDGSEGTDPKTEVAELPEGGRKMLALPATTENSDKATDTVVETLQEIYEDEGLTKKRGRFSGVKVVLLVLAMAGVLALGYFLGKVIGNVVWEKDFAGVREARRESAVVVENTETEVETVGEAEWPELLATKQGELATTKAKELARQYVAVNSGRKLIALTFDDGPSGVTTPRLLNILREKGVKVTFFTIGSMMRGSPDLVRQEIAEGHDVGGHTTGHVNLSTLNAEATQAETAQMNQLFQEITGKEQPFMRPPYGNLTDVTRANIGMPMISWTVDTLDWKYRDPTAVRRAAVSAAFDGAVILMHDIHATTVDAVPGIIDDLRAQGYEFMTVSELAKARGIKLEKGVLYGSFR